MKILEGRWHALPQPFLKMQYDFQNPVRNLYYSNILSSVLLWNFFNGGSKITRFLAKIQHAQRKSLYFVNTINDTLNKFIKNWAWLRCFKNLKLLKINFNKKNGLKLLFVIKKSEIFGFQFIWKWNFRTFWWTVIHWKCSVHKIQ